LLLLLWFNSNFYWKAHNSTKFNDIHFSHYKFNFYVPLFTKTVQVNYIYSLWFITLLQNCRSGVVFVLVWSCGCVNCSSQYNLTMYYIYQGKILKFGAKNISFPFLYLLLINEANFAILYTLFSAETMNYSGGSWFILFVFTLV
jgi:hypothetical protein